jgi:hypothetical protein
MSEDSLPLHLYIVEIDRNNEPEMVKKWSYETVPVGLSHREPEEQLERLQKGAMPFRSVPDSFRWNFTRLRPDLMIPWYPSSGTNWQHMMTSRFRTSHILQKRGVSVDGHFRIFPVFVIELQPDAIQLDPHSPNEIGRGLMHVAIFGHDKYTKGTLRDSVIFAFEHFRVNKEWKPVVVKYGVKVRFDLSPPPVFTKECAEYLEEEWINQLIDWGYITLNENGRQIIRCI